MTRRTISSGGPWEDALGYSRAVVVGDDCWVSGTTAPGGDAATQARGAFATIERALGEAGFGLADVVRVRMHLVDRTDIDAVLGVYTEVLGSVRPAATLLVVDGLIDPALLVEIEVDARRSPPPA